MNPTSVKKTLVLLVKNTRPSLLLPSHRMSTPHVPMCAFITSPCIPTPRTHVSTHVGVVPVHTGTFWTDTRGRVEWTHGIFQLATPHHTSHTHHNTRHNTPQQHDRNNTRRQRHAETENEDREDKTTEERREKIDFQCGGAWPFLLIECFVLLNLSNARFLNLLNSVKYDSF